MNKNPHQLPEALAQLQNLCLLGRGERTQVYTAQWQGRQVILKCLNLRQQQDWKSLQLFEREARALAHLNHPRIPDFIDFVPDPIQQRFYLMTERVPGESLSHLLAQGWRPTEDIVVDIASQALQILTYLHSFSPALIHRDIKPSNLLWDGTQLFLVDFGGVQERLNQVGSGGSTVVGTYGYMAPEQFSGRTLPQSDLYSLGASLIELLSGQSPLYFLQPNRLDFQLKGRLECSPAMLRWLSSLVQVQAHKRPKSALRALKALRRRFRLPEKPFQTLPQRPAGRSLPDVPLENLSIVFSEQKFENEIPHLPGERYLWEADLARGGHYHVWRARDSQTQQAVVVKSLAIASLEDWKILELFEREMQVLKCLQHTRVPRFLERIEAQGVWHMVFEYLPGEDLASRIQSGWRPDENQIFALAQQGLEILRDIHQHKPPLVHRDIKPSNWLLDEAGHLSLIDFGAVSLSLNTQGTGGSTVVGSYGYMAPEQFGGQAYPASDLYGLGVTLIHLLTRRPPTELPMQGLQLEYKSLVDISAALSEFIDGLIAPELHQRYRDAETALNALAEARASHERLLQASEKREAQKALLAQYRPQRQFELAQNKHSKHVYSRDSQRGLELILANKSDWGEHRRAVVESGLWAGWVTLSSAVLVTPLSVAAWEVIGTFAGWPSLWGNTQAIWFLSVYLPAFLFTGIMGYGLQNHFRDILANPDHLHEGFQQQECFALSPEGMTVFPPKQLLSLSVGQVPEQVFLIPWAFVEGLNLVQIRRSGLARKLYALRVIHAEQATILPLLHCKEKEAQWILETVEAWWLRYQPDSVELAFERKLAAEPEHAEGSSF